MEKLRLKAEDGAPNAAGDKSAAGFPPGAYTRPLFSSTSALFVPCVGVLCWFQLQNRLSLSKDVDEYKPKVPSLCAHTVPAYLYTLAASSSLA